MVHYWMKDGLNDLTESILVTAAKSLGFISGMSGRYLDSFPNEKSRRCKHQRDLTFPVKGGSQFTSSFRRKKEDQSLPFFSMVLGAGPDSYRDEPASYF